MSIRGTRQFVDVAHVASGDARVSRQFVETLRQTIPGDARVTRQFVEILYPEEAEKSATVTDTLSLVQQLYSKIEIIKITDELSVSDEVAYAKEILVEIVDELDMDSRGSKAESGFAENLIELAEDILYIQLIGDFTPMSDSLGLVETIEWDNGLYVSPFNTISLSQTVSYLLPIKQYKRDVLHLEDTVEPHWGPKSISLSHTLSLTNNVYKTMEFEFEDELDLSSDVPLRVEDSITITDSVVYGKQVIVTQELGLTQTLSKTANFIRAFSDTMSMIDRFTYRKPVVSCTRKTYDPWMGGDTAAFKNAIGGNITGETVFTVVDTNETVRFPQPIFDNQIRVSRDRVNRESLAGELIVYSDPSWPKLNTLTMTFTNVKTDLATEFMDFVQDNLGREIRLLDYLGREWIGIIINPESVFTENRPNLWGINVEFRGLLSDGHFMGGQLELEDIVEASIG